jgi:hypothetical protein
MSFASTGKIAERIVANELEWRGFCVSDLNRDSNAANADLLAVSDLGALQIQVKGVMNGPSERRCWVSYGYCTNEIMANRTYPMFNRKAAFYRADIVALVGIKSLTEYCCIVLPIAEAERAAQLNISREYRTPTRQGKSKKPGMVYVYLDVAERPRTIAAERANLFNKERAILALHRDEQGWVKLLESIQ